MLSHALMPTTRTFTKHGMFEDMLSHDMLPTAWKLTKHGLFEDMLSHDLIRTCGFDDMLSHNLLNASGMEYIYVMGLGLNFPIIIGSSNWTNPSNLFFYVLSLNGFHDLAWV